MKIINILHLSDSHISVKNSDEVGNLITKLLYDVESEFINNNQNIDLVVFTGDMVQSGHKENFDLSFEKIIFPILDRLGLEDNRFIYVPGNHEVNMQNISEVRNAGLKSILSNAIDAEKYDFLTDNQLYNHMTAYNTFDYAINFNNEVVATKQLIINEVKVGITAINSAWNSNGDSKYDVDSLFVPINKIRKSLEKIKENDIKICLMHHPYDFLRDDFKLSMERVLMEYSLVIYGHAHTDLGKRLSTPEYETFFLMGNTLSNNDTDNGYMLYSINLHNNEFVLHSRKYLPIRNCYDSNISKYKNGIWTTKFAFTATEVNLCYRLKNATQKKIIKTIEDSMITKIINNNINKTFDDFFIMPRFVKVGEVINELEDDEKIEIFSLTLLVKITLQS